MSEEEKVVAEATQLAVVIAEAMTAHATVIEAIYSGEIQEIDFTNGAVIDRLAMADRSHEHMLRLSAMLLGSSKAKDDKKGVAQ